MSKLLNKTNRNLRKFSLIGAIALLALTACGGGGSSDGGTSSGVAGGVTCGANIATTPQNLTSTEVEIILAQAVQASQAIGAKATIAVTDRVGNVLGVYQMTGATPTVNLTSGRSLTSFPQGLDGLTNFVPSELGAIAKAITGAYLSSSGNAFTTRTASFIIQEHFAPTVNNQPGGPLFGVQFSQLPCGDFVTRGAGVINGPKRSPLGLAGDPGGFPLYKSGVVVGGIGVISDGVYGIDINPSAGTTDSDEVIAQSATAGFEAPSCIRGDKITVVGLIPGYSNADKQLVSVNAKTLPATGGSLKAVTGYFTPAAIRAGTAFGTPPSGYTDDPADTYGPNTFIITDGANNRFPPTTSTVGTTPITAAEVTQIITSAIGVAKQSRAQIRRPVGSAANVTVTVVDVEGNILGMGRSTDGPIFGTDVSVQKARTATFFSKSTAGAIIAAQPTVTYAGNAGAASGTTVAVADYNTLSDTFFGTTIFDGGNAFTARAIGNIHRPLFPDGIDGSPNGSLSKPLAIWSPFSVGLELDIVYNKLVGAILNPASTDISCTATATDGINNGIQIFPGGSPIYRGTTLVGGIGVSGDGVDQDDMVGFLGLARASTILGTGIGHAPAGIRSDTLAPQGTPLRYVNCPQTPFNNSDEQNVCAGI